MLHYTTNNSTFGLVSYSVALQGLAWQASKTPLSTPEGQSIE